MNSSKTFIFQSNFDDLNVEQTLKPGSHQVWYANQHRKKMMPGDRVYIWRSGPEGVRGIYGWANLNSAAYQSTSSDSDEPHYEVDVANVNLFKKPLLAIDLKKDPVLKDMLILKAPSGTNFLLDEQQEAALEQVSQGLMEHTK